MQRVGDTFTYTGPCDLEIDFHCDGSVMPFSRYRGHRTVSLTFPSTTPAVPTTPPVVLVPMPEHLPAVST